MRDLRLTRATRFRLLENQRRNKILQQARRNKEIIYGAQSIRRQIGYRSRPTRDFDIFDKNPKKAAINIEKQFDRLAHNDDYYVKPAQHHGTYKVRYEGVDGKKGTKDDISLVDYTTYPSPKPKTKIFNGIRYRALQEEIRAKKQLISNPLYKFRREKDLADLKRIKLYMKRGR